ncbi:50S ribosome-binding protein YggL [Parachitinimonas caeni]|uniref:50S ribosome-binding protein YggL n=1 Tax=Parachitinimonas caeni TaxID=3031301 RepID=A0ABT7DVJ5_9NEIS|nr:50S ribosome-binding protein YggL [Parachitinimonas caeni]MDK2124063.1 50S ribosome-binding protein YggL [Parachitinimonas caeni]
MKRWIDRCSNTRTHRLNPRQRKKYRLGEFQELGFILTGTFKASLEHEAFEAYVDEMLAEATRLGVQCGGSFGLDEFECLIAPFKGSVTEEQRAALTAFVSQHALVASCEATALIDAWYRN